MKESAFQAKVKRRLFEQGCWVFNIHGHREQMAGVPDLHVVHRTWTGYVELKCRNNKLSAIQHSVAKELHARRYPVIVLRDDGTIEDMNGKLICPWSWATLLSCLIMGSRIIANTVGVTVNSSED